MGYTLDLKMEKLLHSLQELLIFRRKFINIVVDVDSPELAILNDAIGDLAQGIAICVTHPDPDEFARKILNCRFTFEIVRVFKEEGLTLYLSPPYFSQSDLNEINK
jgi:hypothetical protein